MSATSSLNGENDACKRTRSVNLTKRVGRYYVGKTIGEGTYAKVKYGQHIDTGETVAIKVLDKEQLVRTGMVDQIKREITILKHIRHPNVVNLKEVMSSKGKIFMVMELVTGGELFDKIAAEGPMREPFARELFAQLLDALGFCHSKGVIHRDLKPENVLLTSDLKIKLSDFGLGVLKESEASGGHLLNTTCGTPNYVAPEVLAKKGYDGVKADIWSLGVVLYVMLAGCLPFDEDDLVSLFKAISEGHYEVPPWLSKDAKAMLQAMLQPDAGTRASVEDLWEMPWMRGQERCTDIEETEHSDKEEENLFKENVQEEGQATKSALLNRSGNSNRKLNAFQLMNEVINLTAIFHDKDDLITRYTKFTSEATPRAILKGIEHATVAVGGRVELRPDNRMKLWVPRAKGYLQVNVELLEMPGSKHVVNLSKVQGNTVDFYNWYADLTAALDDIVCKQNKPRVLSRTLQDGALKHKMNAFELINSNFNLNELFNFDLENAARHVQFTSTASHEVVFAAIERGCIDMGGHFTVVAEKKAILQVPIGGGRKLDMSVRMFQLTAKMCVVQLSRDNGSSLDLFKFYNRLAGQYLSDVLVKRKDGRHIHPKSLKAQALLSTPSTMLLNISGSDRSASSRTSSRNSLLGPVLEVVRRSLDLDRMERIEREE